MAIAAQQLRGSRTLARAPRPRPTAPARRPRAAVGRDRPRRSARRATLGRRLGEVVVTVVLAAAVFATTAVAGSAEVTTPGATTTVVVQPGDTVWSLAARHAPRGANVQAFVAEVVDDNEVEPTGLVPGSTLEVPAR